MKSIVLCTAVVVVCLAGCGSDAPPNADSSATDSTGGDKAAQQSPANALPEEGSLQKTESHAAITVSPETTAVTGPLTPHGRVDFLAALNEAAGKDVQLKDNAVVLLAQTLGTGLRTAADHDRFEQLLGAGRLPVRANPMISQGEFARAQRIQPEQPFFDACANAGTGPWTEAQSPRVAAWLRACDEALDQCVRAFQRPHYYYPLVGTTGEDLEFASPVIGALLPLPQSCRDVARGLQARAMLSLGTGDVEAARRDVVALFQLARHLSGGSTLIELFVGAAIDSMGVDCAVAILNASYRNDDQMSAFKTELDSLSEFGSFVSMIQRGERLGTLDLIQAIADHGPQVLGMLGMNVSEGSRINSRVDWNRSLRIANQAYDQLIEAVSETGFAERVQALQSLNASVKQQAQSDALKTAQLLRGGNSDPVNAGRQMGNLVIALTIPATGQAHIVATRQKLRFELLLLTFDLAEHRRQNDEFPESLGGITDAPDPFTGKPLIYRRTTRGIVVYGRGVNQQDDEGPSPKPSETQDDVGVVLRIADK